ncbi:RCC1 domain-containing protein [Lysobacter brunescens]|uniref:non-specific serine/threonine protein kinase n=1 Tax=Lysobacter brunescens TaxID=262323 RepID=A0ABW2Y7Z0_9GAMM
MMKQMLLAFAAMAVWLAAPLCAHAGRNAADAGLQLDASSDYSCALKENGDLRCWGLINGDNPEPPVGPHLSVSVGNDHVCAIRADGGLACWGGADAAPPAGVFRSVAVGSDGDCAIRDDGRVTCWGGGLAATAPLSGAYLSLDASGTRACAIDSKGELVCWESQGATSLGPPPAGRFLSVAIGAAHACALRSDGEATCWGDGTDGRTEAPAGMRFLSVTAGERHSCGVLVDGRLQCWGSDSEGQQLLPSGRFTALAAGRSHTCARGIKGAIACWGGGGSSGQLHPPQSEGAGSHALTLGGRGAAVCELTASGGQSDIDCSDGIGGLRPPALPFVDIRLGERSGCGILRDGTVRCWGELPERPLADRTGFHRITVGGAHGCALDENGSALCWGDNSDGQANPPTGHFIDIAAGDRFTCGLRGYSAVPVDSVVCWGAGAAVTDKPANSDLQGISASDGNVCAYKYYGAAICWGSAGQTIVPPATFNSRLNRVVVGARHACAWRDFSNIVCWGDNSAGQRHVPMSGGGPDLIAAGDTTCSTFLGTVQCWGAHARTLRAGIDFGPYGVPSLEAGERHTCTKRSGGTVRCWGEASAGKLDPPLDRMRAIGVGGHHACGINGVGRAQCWGDGEHDGNIAPAEDVRAIGLGFYNGCAILTHGAVSCWGWNANGQGTPPDGVFRIVASGLSHACGVRDDGTLACWGYDADGQASPPQGRYRAIDVGERHSCAIADTGELLCWGLGSEGQTDAPAGRFRALSVAAFHACAIRSDGGIACWGRNDQGQATPPTSGAYVSIATGFAHSCAVRDTGGRVCWGNNTLGQAPAFTMLPEALPPGRVGELYRVDLMYARNGDAYRPDAIWFEHVAGELPQSMHLLESGRLVGEFMPEDEGEHRFTLSVVDANGVEDRREYRLSVRPPDNTPPMVEPVVAGPVGNAHWYRGDVTVRWNVTDPESTITQAIGCDEEILSNDTARLDFICTATSAGGTTEHAVTVRRDTVAPDTVLTEVPPAQANYGIRDQRFAFETTAVHDLSGLAGFECETIHEDVSSGFSTCSSPFVLSAPLAPGEWQVRVRALDIAGNFEDMPATYTWRIQADVSPPVVRPLVDGVPTLASWYTSDVALDWEVSDSQTPVTGRIGCEPFVWREEGISPVQSCEATSGGGTGRAQVFLRKDSVPPVVVAAPTVPAGASGWHNNVVRVVHACTDATSGVSACPPSEIVTAEGMQVVQSTLLAMDYAGNAVRPSPIVLKIDLASPQLTWRISHPADINGWHRIPPVVEFICSDLVSGLASGACPEPVTVSSEGAQLLTRSVTDIAGLTSSVTMPFSVDLSPPTLAISRPDRVVLGSKPIASANASDLYSGVASQSCSAMDTSTIGRKSVTCTATDRVGHVATASATYDVVYGFTASSAPLSNPAQLHTIEAPRSVVFDWRVHDAAGNAITNAAVVSTDAVEIACPAGGMPLMAAPGGETDTIENFGDGRYRRNWWINYTGKVRCLRLSVTLDDGQARSAIVRVQPKRRVTGGPKPSELAPQRPKPLATPRIPGHLQKR